MIKPLKENKSQLISNYHMVDVSKKKPSYRKAIASGCISVSPQTFALLKNRTLPKGDALLLAEIAGIQGAKRAYDYIPLCHPLPLEQVSLLTALDEENCAVNVYCIASTFAKTGVEMEALAGVNAALLAIYDLCKMVDPAIFITHICLLYKEGGKSGVWKNPQKKIPECIQQLLPKETLILTGLRSVVISISDRAFQGTKDYPDAGIYLQDELINLGAVVEEYVLLPDEENQIATKIQELVKKYSPDLLLLRGGTGLSHRDRTPDAVLAVCDREVPGLGELIRQASEKYTPFSWLSRAVGATLENTLILTLPGSPNAITEVLSIVKDILPKAIHELHKDA